MCLGSQMQFYNMLSRVKINKAAAAAFNTNTEIWQGTKVIDEVLVPFELY